jgi:hypothetical protein
MEVGAVWHPDGKMNTHAEALQQFLLHAYGQ